MKNNVKEKTIELKEVNFEQYRNTGGPQQRKLVGENNIQPPIARIIYNGLAEECATKDQKILALECRL